MGRGDPRVAESVMPADTSTEAWAMIAKVLYTFRCLLEYGLLDGKLVGAAVV